MRWSALLVVLAVAQPALAETKADALFKKGKQQLADKKYSLACVTFEKVDRLDPGIGAKLNVAKCYEEWGKLAKAYRWYSDAEKMADESSDKRRPKIKELLETLDSDVPRLTIKLPPGVEPAGLKAKLDGAAVEADAFGSEQRVDPGSHVIEYEANGEKKSKTVPLERGGSTEVTLEIPKRVVKPKADPIVVIPPKTAPPKPPSRARLIAGIAIGSAGVAALGVSGYLTLDARSAYNDALATHCMGSTNMCSDEGVRITGDARSRANTATVIAVIGAAAVAGGVVLFVTAPKRRSNEAMVYLAPAIGSDGGGIVLGGGF